MKLASPVATAVRFVTGRSALGAVLVAMGQGGIAAIMLGDDPEALHHAARANFPGARPVHDAMADRVLAQVRACIDTPWARPALKLDMQGTSFQLQVWQALRAIPCGTTATYTELAARIGRPGAVRAVAGACAANRLAVVIPCHRVIRSDGGLSGYRWGVGRKQWLLERERAGMVQAGNHPVAVQEI
ncbi:cysteine methyltransferase [Komagataeibacter xylinus]|nr:Methylated-DNA-[protein]-cysteine S-methyltransferase [Komagataeibacter xylinus E25]RFO99137.1 cysteine methyltransferase [Komagataeibacter xylinus]RFP07469.1 cysteine methyltransferase [Komagataeibacter xylinus]